MKLYLCRFYDSHGRLVASEPVTAPSDIEALGAAHSRSAGRAAFELWCEGRLVFRYEPGRPGRLH
jgi:hypothetical protein